MEKKSKVTEVKPLNKKDDFGNFSFVIKFENNDFGFYTTKDEKASAFKVGEEITYVYEERPKKDNSGVYTKISLPKKDFVRQGGGGNYQLSIEDYVLRQKMDSVGYAMSYAEKLVEAGKAELANVKTLAKDIHVWMVAQYDELYLKNKK